MEQRSTQLGAFIIAVALVTTMPAQSAFAEGIVGDFDQSGVVDFDDFFAFADAFGSSNPDYDLDGEDPVGIFYKLPKDMSFALGIMELRPL